MKRKNTYLIVIFLIAASFITYGRTLGHGFINLDDDLYITDNHYIKSGINPGTIKWAFSAVVSANWHPLTLLSHALDWSLFGANASGHHLINLFLHIGSVIFLFFFLNRMTKSLWSSAFAAAVFALHPLRVESVVWASERKDVLSMFFGMAALYAYGLYAESLKLSKYFLSLILFALSLMAKPMLVTLPFVLLLLDYWPLRRWKKALNPADSGVINNALPATDESESISAPAQNADCSIIRLLCEKAPFIFLTIIFSIVTLWAQNKGHMITSLEHSPFLVRVQNAVISYVSYLGKIFWPVDLAVFYPYEHSFPLWHVLLSCFILSGITIVVIDTIKKLPFLFVGWFWFLGTLIPVIGLVQVSTLARADRYTYLPSIGIAIMLAWGVPLLFPSANTRKKILFPVVIGILAILAVLTWQQCGYWKNNTSLFSHALQVTKNNYLAHNIRGIAYGELGQYQRAILDFNKAIHFKPDYADAYNNRGNAYVKLGQYQRAILDFNEAIRLNPNSAKAYYNRGGFAFNNLGQYQRAIEDFNKAIRLNPDLVMAYEGKGAAYCKLGQYQRAIEDFNEAIRLKPDDTFAYGLRGAAYLMQGNKKQSCRDVQKACAWGDCKWLEWAKSYGYCR